MDERAGRERVRSGENLGAGKDVFNTREHERESDAITEKGRIGVYSITSANLWYRLMLARRGHPA